MTSDSEHTEKVIFADFRESFEDSDADSGAGSDDKSSGRYVSGFDYIDPGLLGSGNVSNLNFVRNARENVNTSFKKKYSGTKSLI